MKLVITPEHRLRALLKDSIRQESSLGQAPAEFTAKQASIGWISNAEAIEILRLSRATLARYRRSGLLPYSKLGSNIFYRAADIAAVLEARVRNRGVQDPSQGPDVEVSA